MTCGFAYSKKTFDFEKIICIAIEFLNNIFFPLFLSIKQILFNVYTLTKHLYLKGVTDLKGTY